MKFDTQTVCTQNIILGYKRLENLYNNGVLGGKTLQKIAFNNNEPIAMKFEIEIVCTE